MFGIGSTAIVCAIAGCIAATALCIVYGAINWNCSDDKGDKK